MLLVRAMKSRAKFEIAGAAMQSVSQLHAGFRDLGSKIGLDLWWELKVPALRQVTLRHSQETTTHNLLSGQFEFGSPPKRLPYSDHGTTGPRRGYDLKAADRLPRSHMTVGSCSA